jgi:cardiolipin synthase A/B
MERRVKVLYHRARLIGESPSGKASVFGADIRWFESILPSHAARLRGRSSCNGYLSPMPLLLGILIPVALLLAYVVWVKSRRRPLRYVTDRSVDAMDLARSFAALTWGHLIDGNSVEIIQNSAFFGSLLEDIASATDSVHLETFLWRDGAVSDRVSAALAVAAERGIEVRVLVDQRGAKQTSPAVWARLRNAGCNFRVYHRARFREFAWYNHRDHRKIAVIDGRIGYTFGHGIADMWGGSPEEPAGWRDTAARFQGPVVNALQSGFFENWTRTTAEAVATPRYFPRLERAGNIAVHVAFVSPRETPSAVQRLYYLAIASAREEIILQNPYFLPDRQALALFEDAVKRGVRVRIMLPTAATSDFAIVQHASHYYYGPLLRLGVEVFEYEKCGLHQKVMIIDGAWFTIGSTNFDPRSFRINDEITVGVHDRSIAQDLRRCFELDAQSAHLWTLAEWNGRDFAHRVKDRASSLVKRQL